MKRSKENMRVINLSLKEYTEGHPVATNIVTEGKYLLIVIDDVDIKQRNNIPLPKWVNDSKSNMVHYLYCTFKDSEDEGEDCLTDNAAELLADEIVYCKDNDISIIVSCIAGLSRSGAITQACVDYGFEDTGKTRYPNNRIKNMLKKYLGIGISKETSAFNNL